MEKVLFFGLCVCLTICKAVNFNCKKEDKTMSDHWLRDYANKHPEQAKNLPEMEKVGGLNNADQVVLKEALIKAMDKGVKAQREALDNAEQVELKHPYVKDNGREM